MQTSLAPSDWGAINDNEMIIYSKGNNKNSWFTSIHWAEHKCEKSCQHFYGNLNLQYCNIAMQFLNILKLDPGGNVWHYSMHYLAMYFSTCTVLSVKAILLKIYFSVFLVYFSACEQFVFLCWFNISLLYFSVFLKWKNRHPQSRIFILLCRIIQCETLILKSVKISCLVF